MEYNEEGKHNGILKFAGKWIELEEILSEESQSQKVEHHIYSLIYGFYT